VAWPQGILVRQRHVQGTLRGLEGSDQPIEAPGNLAFQAGHAGSIPVTRSTRIRKSGGLSGLLEQLWRSLRKARLNPFRTPAFHCVGHEWVTPPTHIQPGEYPLGTAGRDFVTQLGHGSSASRLIGPRLDCRTDRAGCRWQVVAVLVTDCCEAQRTCAPVRGTSRPSGRRPSRRASPRGGRQATVGAPSPAPPRAHTVIRSLLAPGARQLTSYCVGRRAARPAEREERRHAQPVGPGQGGRERAPSRRRRLPRRPWLGQPLRRRC